jgi:hypothetical protein
MLYGTTRVGFLPQDKKNQSGEGHYQQGLQLYREEGRLTHHIMCT